MEPFQVMFEQLRELGQTTSPSPVLPGLIAQAHSLRSLANNAKRGHPPPRSGDVHNHNSGNVDGTQCSCGICTAA